MSGATNFFNQGWPWHKALNKLGILDFKGVTFVAKTTTIDPREGHMPLKENLMPREIYPRCIHVDYFNQRVLNSVALSGPGLVNLLNRNIWQNLAKPFMISFMPVAEKFEDKIFEAQRFVLEILKRIRNEEFRSRFGVQINFSCPNTGEEKLNAGENFWKLLDEFIPLHDEGVAIEVKFAIDTPVNAVVFIEKHGALDGICISNSIPFGSMDLPWEKWYPHGSPLVRRKFKGPIDQTFGRLFWRGKLDPKFKGGLSGAPLRPLVLKWIKKLRSSYDFVKPINGGGGILSPYHIDMFEDAGADSYSIGCVAILRPWQVQPIIKRAHELHSHLS